MRIHYRPLAFRRSYESVCLPVPPTMTRRTGSYAASFGLYAQAVEGPAPRPDPLGDAVARGAEAVARGRARPPTTREIPIAVDATLPAVAAALERLRGELTAMGLAHQAARVQAIGLAVEHAARRMVAQKAADMMPFMIRDTRNLALQLLDEALAYRDAL